MILIPDHQLQIRNTKIYSPKIKVPFKLVALGDTHVSEMMEKTKLYPVQLQIEKENPDYINLNEVPDDMEIILRLLVIL